MNKLSQRRFITAILLNAIVLLVAFTFATTKAAAAETLNNASVIELQGLNLGDAVIIDKIKTSQCDFDTSIDGLKQLKNAKVSSAVIQAMLATKSTISGGGATPSSAGINVNDPLAMHTAGVWVLQEVNGQPAMSPIDFYQPQFGTKSTGYNPWTGVSVEQFVYLPGLHSQTQLSTRRPVFYFYFVTGQQLATQGGAYEFMNLQNPDELVLIRFQTKDGQRQITVSKGNGWYYSQNLNKGSRNFDAEKVADGIYKITPNKDLMNGEYAFTGAPQQGHGQSFPFGIASAEPYHYPDTITDPEIKSLCETLKSGKSGDVGKALKTLREMDAPEAVPQILPCLQNSNSNVKRDACRTLAVLGDKSIVPSIEPLLKDSHKDVVKDAQDAIDVLNTR